MGNGVTLANAPTGGLNTAQTNDTQPPTTETKPTPTPAAKPTPPGSAGAASTQKAGNEAGAKVLSDADALIKSVLGDKFTPPRDHFERVQIIADIAKSLPPAERAKFVATLKKIGEPFGINFGFNGPSVGGKPVPLNDAAFRGLDAQHSAVHDDVFKNWNQGKARAAEEASKRTTTEDPAAEAGTEQAGTEQAGTGAPQADQGKATETDQPATGGDQPSANSLKMAKGFDKDNDDSVSQDEAKSIPKLAEYLASDKVPSHAISVTDLAKVIDAQTKKKPE
jgi:hypothetical protein